MTIIGAAMALALGAPAIQPVTARIAIEGSETQATIHEVVVPANSDQVWQAIATPEGWRTWAAPLVWADPGDPTIFESNYNPAAKPGDGGAIAQRIILVVPQRIYAFRTIKATSDFPNFEALKQVTWVFELVPEGTERTRVRLTGSGYPRTRGGDQLLAFFDRGNSVSLELLRQRFAQGPIDWATKRKGAHALTK